MSWQLCRFANLQAAATARNLRKIPPLSFEHIEMIMTIWWNNHDNTKSINEKTFLSKSQAITQLITIWASSNEDLENVMNNIHKTTYCVTPKIICKYPWYAFSLEIKVHFYEAFDLLPPTKGVNNNYSLMKKKVIRPNIARVDR